jgi:preprotein translocase subunit SecG
MGIYIFISILVIIACLLVIMVVLVQNSKGGGLASNFTSAGQSMGYARQLTSLRSQPGPSELPSVAVTGSTAAIPRGEVGKESVIKSSIERARIPMRYLCFPHRLRWKNSLMAVTNKSDTE